MDEGQRNLEKETKEVEANVAKKFQESGKLKSLQEDADNQKTKIKSVHWLLDKISCIKRMKS